MIAFESTRLFHRKYNVLRQFSSFIFLSKFALKQHNSPAICEEN